MKKIAVYVLLFGFIIASNAFGQNPGRNESLIVVNALFANPEDTLEVYVDDEKKVDVKHNTPMNIVVPNGDCTLTLVVLNGHLRNRAVSKSEIPLNLNSEKITFEFRINNFRSINSTIKSRTPLNAASSASSTGSNIEDALYKITTALKNRMPQNATIAVLSISSPDQDMAAFAIDELEFQLVNTNLFRMVDRKTLDSLRVERNFQMSGEVSDDSAVSIGNMLGASIVITGSITGAGNTRRITIKALDVSTAQIVAIAREGF